MRQSWPLEPTLIKSVNFPLSGTQKSRKSVSDMSYCGIVNGLKSEVVQFRIVPKSNKKISLDDVQFCFIKSEVIAG